MTRATLLHVLERPTALGPAEVRELEQLAQAFPYCQTAHLLLAKAAHDQGTMLASQRLRRAATYAADRTLLRRLIEQENEEAAPEPIPVSAAPHPLDLVDWPDEYVPPTAAPVAAAPLPAAVAPPEIAPSLPELIALPEREPALAPGLVPGPSVAPIAGPVELLAAPGATVAELIEAPATASAATAPVVIAEAEAPEAAALSAPAAPEAGITAPATEAPILSIVETVPASGSEIMTPAAAETPVTVEATSLPAQPLPAEAPAPEAAAVSTGVQVTSSLPDDAEPEAELPAQAPAIRPPVEVGEARFEFGLAAPAPVAAVPTYELPGLVDEWAASAVTRSMGSPEILTPATLAPPKPAFTPAAFTGDAVVGYAFGESSRLGLSMQLLDLLTAKAEAAESATAIIAAAQPPATALPPTGTFFEPDPLLLDHWATHRPAAPELPSTVDLINNFLKRQPRLTRPGMLPPAPGGQPDLSVRSTRAEPDLVSENLARIFVRQGKTGRAIEIYEKLMVKQPEKMAYFALQIQSLQPSA